MTEVKTNRLFAGSSIFIASVMTAVHGYAVETKAATKKPAPLTQVWELSQGLDAPESSFYDETSDTIYVSNVAGDAVTKDGVGWISKVSSKGQMLEEKWVFGLDAPKGIRIHAGKLWVSDIDRVLMIDVKNPKERQVISIPGSKFLNDVAIDANGTVYVSDMMTNRIHSIEKGVASVFVEGDQLESPNGLLVQPPYLRVVGWGTGMQSDFTTKTQGSLYNINLKTKKKSKVTDAFGNLDGVEALGRQQGGFLVSDWMNGKIFRTTKSSKPTLLLDGLQGSADIGYILKSKILLVPQMKASKLTAYKVNPA